MRSSTSPTTECDIVADLREAHAILTTLVDEVRPLVGVDSSQLLAWQSTLEAAAASLQQQRLRLAVVGSVKAGKSTFINALCGRDLLKRGTGVVTAFITRLLSGQRESGWVELKPWGEINREASEAMAVIAAHLGREMPSAVDLRQQKDVKLLTELLEEAPEAGGNIHGFDANLMRLRAYLNGLRRLQPQLAEQPVRIEFGAGELEGHRDFVSDESLAVYLRDVKLVVHCPWIEAGVELADCQGSDAPNPAHYARLQHYLLGCHGVIYILNSRMGIRQADVHLINTIKTMRLLPQTLFLLNVDLDGCESTEHLQEGWERVHSELRLLVGEAKLHMMSALLDLLLHLEANKVELPRREQRRLQLWREMSEEVEILQQGSMEFRQDLESLVQSQRQHSLAQGVRWQLQRVTAAMLEAVHARQELLGRDNREIARLAGEIDQRAQAVRAVVANVEHTLEGVVLALKKEVGQAADSFFDTTYGPVAREVMEFIDTYAPEAGRPGGAARWWRQIPGLYQQLRRGLARYLAEYSNVRIFDFAKEQEERIIQRVEAAAAGYWELLEEAVGAYRVALGQHALVAGDHQGGVRPQFSRPQVQCPIFSRFFLESALPVNPGALLAKFGASRTRLLSGRIWDLLRRRSKGDEEERLYRTALAVARRELKKEVLACWRDYRQNFKHAYLFAFVDDCAAAVVHSLRTAGETTLVDMGTLGDAARREDRRQEETTADLAIVNQRLRYVQQRLHPPGQDGVGLT